MKMNSKRSIKLDHSKLLGFDQVGKSRDHARVGVKVGSKVGSKTMRAAIGAKIGAKAGVKSSR